MNDVYYHVYTSTHWQTGQVKWKEQILINLHGTDIFIDGYGAYNSAQRHMPNYQTIILEKIGVM